MTSPGEQTPARPSEQRWGEQTRLAVENFPLSGGPMPIEVIHALAQIKHAAEMARARGVSDATVDRMTDLHAMARPHDPTSEIEPGAPS